MSDDNAVPTDTLAPDTVHAVARLYLERGAVAHVLARAIRESPGRDPDWDSDWEEGVTWGLRRAALLLNVGHLVSDILDEQVEYP